MEKSKILAAIQEMPEQFSAEDLIQRIIFIDKIEKGVEQSLAGKTITLEEVKERLDRKWSE